MVKLLMMIHFPYYILILCTFFFYFSCIKKFPSQKNIDYCYYNSLNLFTIKNTVTRAKERKRERKIAINPNLVHIFLCLKREQEKQRSQHIMRNFERISFLDHNSTKNYHYIDIKITSLK